MFFKKIIEKKKEKKRIAQENKEKKLISLKNEYAIFTERIKNKCEEENKYSIDLSDDANKSCPNCRCNDIIRVYRDINGSMNGSIHGYSTFLGGSVDGFINGSLKTDRVNKCNKCKHEWEIKTYNFTYVSDKLKFALKCLLYYFESFDDYLSTTFDKNDITEKYSSLEEKRKNNPRSTVWDEYVVYYYSGISMEMILEILNYDVGIGNTTKNNIYKGIHKYQLQLHKLGMRYYTGDYNEDNR